MRGERAEGPAGPVSVSVSVSPRCPWPAAASRRRLLLLACLPALLLGLETGSAPLLTAEPRKQCVNGSREPPDPRRLPTALPDPHRLTTALPDPHRLATALPDPRRLATALPDPRRLTTALPDPRRLATALPDPRRLATTLPDPHRLATALPDPRGLPHLATTNSSSNDCQCKSWLFHLHNGLVRNIVTQWSLVCNSSWKVHIAKFSLLVGLIFGYLVCGCLADWVGRQLVLVVTVLFVLVFGLTLALSVNVTMFITLRFFEGFSLAGVFLTLYVARIEIAQSNQRFMITMAASFIAMGGQLLTPGLAALCRNWQVLQTVIICPFIFMIPYWCIFPESLSWLLATQQSHAAKDLLLDYARKHQQEPEEDVKEFLSELEKEPPVKAQKVFILKLLSTRILWKHILVLCVTSLAGFGVHNCFVKSLMDQEEGTLANFYAHYYTIEVVGILSCVVMCFLVSLMGRRGTLLVFTIVTALASLLQLGLISNLTTLKEPFSIAFSLVGLFSSHSMGNLSIFICAELTPTVMRAGGLGLVLASAGFGQLTAPIMELHNQKGYFLHHVVFACCTVICIICILLLPESGGRELPVTLQDADVHPRRPLLPSRRSARSLLSHTELKSYSGLASHPPHRDTSSPTANGRSPPANGSSANVNVPSANVNGHSPTANGPSVNVHSPTANVTSANVNGPSPTANDPSPNANDPSPNANGHT